MRDYQTYSTYDHVKINETPFPRQAYKLQLQKFEFKNFTPSPSKDVDRISIQIFQFILNNSIISENDISISNPHRPPWRHPPPLPLLPPISTTHLHRIRPHQPHRSPPPTPFRFRYNRHNHHGPHNTSNPSIMPNAQAHLCNGNRNRPHRSRRL